MTDQPPSPITDVKVRVLLVDDQMIIVEAIRRMLADQDDIEFHYVTDSVYAETSAERIAPTVILQDLVMPDIDGFSLIKYYRDNAKLRDVPVVVLSAREEPKTRAQGFAAGANDYMVKLPERLELIARLRYHSAGYINGLQRDEALVLLRASRLELAETKQALRELRGAFADKESTTTEGNA